MIRRLHRSDAGVTLTELTVAISISAILGLVMMTWLTGVAETDRSQEQEFAALDQMRVAKGRLTKELRFAETIDPGLPQGVMLPNIIFADGPDVIEWSIDPSGELIRDDGSGPAVQAIHLIPASSGFTINGESVTIEWHADVDTSSGPAAKSIRTEVFVRN